MRNQNLLKTLGAATCAAALLIATPATATQTPAQPPATPTTVPAQPATPTAAPAQPDMPKTPAAVSHASANADARFVTHAAEGGMIEVAKGKLAAQKGAHEGVKQFGQKMVNDHTKAGDELKSIATGKTITLPGETLTSPMQAMLAKLEKLEGPAFDRAYVEDQVRDHEKTIALFEREVKTGKDAELKAFAEKTLPTLKEHLTMLQDLKTKVAKGATD
jgi:putative membrane protein